MKKQFLLFIFGLIIGGLAINQVLYQKMMLSPVAVLPDGGVYYGAVSEGVFSGKGEIHWPNDTYYKGGFLQGRFHGNGKLSFLDESYFEGTFTKGEMTGEGLWVFKNGTTSQGTFLNGVLNGKGEYRTDLESYEGLFKDGQYHGEGTYSSDQEQYIGEFEYGLYHGKGKHTDSEGNIYEGEFEKGHFQGKGKYTSKNGDVFSGQFVNGKLSGQGQYLGADGEVYDGLFEDWLYHGQGLFKYVEGGQWTGTFEEGYLTGQGEYLGQNGESYVGEFKHWEYHGFGVYTNSNGNVYSGEFKRGRFHGSGEIKYAAPLDGYDSLSGNWYRGRLTATDTHPDFLNDTALNELVLYNQNDLLKRTWQGLKEQSTDSIDMYFLSVAGDGSQGVFRRETLAAKNYFDSKLSTDGRSMSLINSALTAKTHAMGTQTSIHKSLSAIANVMDNENDILFLYLSSHGSKDHELYLNSPKLSLDDLSANALSKMLEELPIKWKVIVVSACYSGGFIPELANDSTMIITSSSADNVSFGCEDNNEFTYFGEAFIKHSLPHALSFVDAFDHAKSLIRTKELEQDYEHSEPQIYKPKGIVNHLKRWRSNVGIASSE